MKTTLEFEEAYKGLNVEQKLAVDTVEGPVLVVAGPGTGKTHILTLRIANILRVTQAQPKDILALTFTDSAAYTMRRRLTGIVGEAVARDVTITTFHGFAEMLISKKSERFPVQAIGRLAGDVEQVLLFRSALDTTDVELVRPPKAPYTYLNDIKRMYDTMTREAFSLQDYRAWAEEERKRIKNDPSLAYKRGEKMGELTKDGLEKLERLDKVDEVCRVLETYTELKEKNGVYDFSDLLRTVITRIAEDETLRAELQEQYQYILADEHQDANALQHQLLELFAIDDHPNLFVVGDEKQAIYRFQGAEAGGFADFLAHFPRAKVITLTSSFRSYQNVLDSAHEVIAETGNHTKLTAMRGDHGPALSLILGSDPLDERARIVTKIQKLIREGTKPHDIAVISRKNEIADLVSQELDAGGVPALRAGDSAFRNRPLIRALLALMEYVANPLRLDALRNALLAPWWNLNQADVLRLLTTSSDKELAHNFSRQFPLVADQLKECIEKSLTQTPLVCFSFILSESGARDYLLSHHEHLDDMNLVRQLMMHVEEVTLYTKSASFRDVMHELVLAEQHDISPIKTSITEREGMVTVITAHKAKGMEFTYVFIPDLTENGWEKGGKPAMLPSPFENKQSLDDARRLLYVAITRAKDHAFLSYATESKDGRDRKVSNLVPEGIREIETESTPLPIMHDTKKAPEVITALSKQYLVQEGLSPSAVNEYLESPATFFARRVLRVKEPPEGPAMSGNAVHKALSYLLEGKSPEAAHAALEKVFTTSLLPRGKIFDDLLRNAHASFDAALPTVESLGKPLHIEKAFRTHQTFDGVEVLLQGKIDAVFETPQGIRVVDWKTSSSLSPKDENYVRQLMLYIELLDANDITTEETMLVGISPESMKLVPVAITAEARALARGEFETVVQELLSGVWRIGQPSKYDALLALVS